MSTLQLARPGADEAAPYYHRYIAAVADEHIGLHLAGQIGQLETLLRPLDDSAALARYAEGKWSIKEVVGHLIDAERIFAYRLLRISRGDTTPLASFEENAYVVAARFDERPLAALQAEFRAVRLSTVALVEGVRPECWAWRGRASDQAVSARALVYILLGHVAHHVAVLQERYNLRAHV